MWLKQDAKQRKIRGYNIHTMQLPESLIKVDIEKNNSMRKINIMFYETPNVIHFSYDRRRWDYS